MHIVLHVADTSGAESILVLISLDSGVIIGGHWCMVLYKCHAVI